MGTCIKTGEIVWFHGPFKAGSFHDITIFRLGLKQLLPANEVVWADKGYRGDPKCLTPYDEWLGEQAIKEMRLARMRHETVNGRLAAWSIQKDIYRHNLNDHHTIFTCIAIITQIEMLNGWRPFDCDSTMQSASHRLVENL